MQGGSLLPLGQTSVKAVCRSTGLKRALHDSQKDKGKGGLLGRTRELRMEEEEDSGQESQVSLTTKAILKLRPTRWTL
jgi:hypothetical protein